MLTAGRSNGFQRTLVVSQPSPREFHQWLLCIHQYQICTNTARRPPVLRSSLYLLNSPPSRTVKFARCRTVMRSSPSSSWLAPLQTVADMSKLMSKLFVLWRKAKKLWRKRIFERRQKPLSLQNRVSLLNIDNSRGPKTAWKGLARANEGSSEGPPVFTGADRRIRFIFVSIDRNYFTYLNRKKACHILTQQHIVSLCYCTCSTTR